MPSNTTYYNLWVFDPTTDTGSTFLTFRSDIAGTGAGSNMLVLDAALHTHDLAITALQSVKGVIYVPALYQSTSFYTAAAISGIAAYADGMIIDLMLDQTSGATVTLAINGLATKSLYKYDSAGSLTNMAAGDLYAKREHLFRYSTSVGGWIWIDATSADQINIAGTSGNVVTVSSDGTLLGTTTQSLLISATTLAATTKATPIDADIFPLVDTAASNVLKGLTWANLKATIKAYYDAVASTLTNKLLSDSTTYFANVADATKHLVMSLGDATTSKTMTIVSSHTDNRSLTLPDVTDTLVAKTTIDTLTNKRVTKRVLTAATNSGTPTINTDLCDIILFNGLTVTISNMTTNLTGTPVLGDKLEFVIADNGVIKGITTWGTSFVARGVALPTTTVAGKWLRVGFEFGVSGFWDCIAVAQEA